MLKGASKRIRDLSVEIEREQAKTEGNKQSDGQEEAEHEQDKAEDWGDRGLWGEQCEGEEVYFSEEAELLR